VPSAAQKQPAPQAATEPASAPPAAAKSAQPAGPSAEVKAQLQEQRERMMLLGGRAAAVAGSVDNLRRQQSASGLGLRGDMAAARESMDYMMGEAKSALASGDPATAKRSLDMAEQQVEKLEKFLGR
jgi:serine/threonine-protein kinase